MAEKGKFLEHWPTVFFGFLVAVILLIAVFSYQVNETELVVVTTLGQVEPVASEPGLHFRWPYPFQDVIKFDKRRRCFEGNEGRIEETRTADGSNIMVGIFVNYNIDNAAKFNAELGTLAKAEDLLNSQMRSIKNATFGRYRFDQLINPDPAKIKLAEIQQQIQTELATSMGRFGIHVDAVGVSTLNQPQTITSEILKRMVEERKLEAQTYLSNGNTDAQRIRIAADSESRTIITNAEAEAKEIRAKGDADAAQYYAVFKQNPELAAFLRKLESLSRIMQTKTTLILDTNAAPFDLLQSGSDRLGAKSGQ